MLHAASGVNSLPYQKGTSECLVANQSDRVRFVLVVVAINFADIIEKLWQ